MKITPGWCVWALLAACTSVTAVGDEPASPPARSYDAVQAEVAALKKQDVAWRKIEWKTCLLDGLRESKQQQKPVIRWIFIDRPIDDERC